MENTDLATALIEHTKVLREYIKIEREKRSPWCDADEAATMLGLNITKSRKHARLLRRLIDRGIITKFHGKPTMYSKEEIRQISAKVLAGKLSIR